MSEARVLEADPGMRIHVQIIYKEMPQGRASQVALEVKNLPASSGDLRDVGSDPWVRKIPWKKAWQPTPVFLSGESPGQRSLEGYSPWGLQRAGHN